MKHMTIKHLIDMLEKVGPKRDHLADHLSILLRNMTPLTMGEIHNFQLEWDSGSGYEEFCKAQLKIIKSCLEIECSDIGADVRKEYGLLPLDMSNEVIPFVESGGSN